MPNVTHLKPRTMPRAAYSLRAARIGARLTQEQAAELCGIPLRTYAAYELGQRPLRPLEAYLTLTALTGRVAA